MHGGGDGGGEPFPRTKKPQPQLGKEEQAQTLIDSVRRNESFVSTDETKQRLLFYWSSFAIDSLSSAAAITYRDWFDRLYSMHTQPDRHYHTAVHLLEMCQLYDYCRGTFFGPSESTQQIILLSIFFHDCIYNAQSSTNEQDSAKFFQEFAQSVQLDATTKNLVVDFILATMLHQLPHDESNTLCNNPNTRHALELFLDLDMAILGKYSSAYRTYATCIRKEYNHVPPSVYCDKRADVLEAFLDDRPLYFTPQLLELLQDTARQNLRDEIDCLRRGDIPGTNGSDNDDPRPRASSRYAF